MAREPTTKVEKERTEAAEKFCCLNQQRDELEEKLKKISKECAEAEKAFFALFD